MKQMMFKSKSMIFALLVVTSLLTGCATNSSEELSSLSIYQAQYLYLKKGQVVQTQKGKYTAQIDEVWVNREKYRELEAQNITLSTQVRKLTAQIDTGK